MNHRPSAGLLYLSRRRQWLILGLLLLVITVAHNSLPMPAAAFLMSLTQKLFFVPVILAGFWFGLSGGIVTALIACALFPHYGLDHGHHGSILSLELLSDLALLVLVGAITGWLRNRLDAELEQHRRTAGERDQAREAVHQSYERVERAEHLAALGQMAAGIAHEVRNPLTSMQGAVDILQRSLDSHPERARPLLERLQHEIARLDELTRHFLTFARPPEAQLQWLNPDEAVHAAVQMLSAHAQQSGRRIDFTPAPHMRTLRTDRDQLRQVTINLLLNALQFAAPGSTVRVTTRNSDARWELAVSNAGPPIPAELRAHIFEPFFTTRPEGTGLGLAVSARIAEALHGTLDCASENGLTTFTLSLPEGRDVPADPDH